MTDVEVEDLLVAIERFVAGSEVYRDKVLIKKSNNNERLEMVITEKS